VMAMKQSTKQILTTYGIAFATVFLNAIVMLGKSPFDFTASDWHKVANGVWVSLLPVIYRYLDKQDLAFGLKPPTHR